MIIFLSRFSAEADASLFLFFAPRLNSLNAQIASTVQLVVRLLASFAQNFFFFFARLVKSFFGVGNFSLLLPLRHWTERGNFQRQRGDFDEHTRDTTWIASDADCLPTSTSTASPLLLNLLCAVTFLCFKHSELRWQRIEYEITREYDQLVDNQEVAILDLAYENVILEARDCMHHYILIIRMNKFDLLVITSQLYGDDTLDYNWKWKWKERKFLTHTNCQFTQF